VEQQDAAAYSNKMQQHIATRCSSMEQLGGQGRTTHPSSRGAFHQIGTRQYGGPRHSSHHGHLSACGRRNGGGASLCWPCGHLPVTHPQLGPAHTLSPLRRRTLKLGGVPRVGRCTSSNGDGFLNTEAAPQKVVAEPHQIRESSQVGWRARTWPPAAPLPPGAEAAPAAAPTRPPPHPVYRLAPAARARATTAP
jgi:hypothetical protein